MTVPLYITAALAITATLLALTRLNALHALLYLVVSLLATAVIFLLLGAPFAFALEIIVYAGAIMVFFLFVVMMLDLGPAAVVRERAWLPPAAWLLPGLLTLLLLVEVLYAVLMLPPAALTGAVVPPTTVGQALFGTYGLAAELASFILLAGLVGALHLGRRSGEQIVAREPHS